MENSCSRCHPFRNKWRLLAGKGEPLIIDGWILHTFSRNRLPPPAPPLFSLHFTVRFARIDTVMFSVRPRCSILHAAAASSVRFGCNTRKIDFHFHFLAAWWLSLIISLVVIVCVFVCVLRYLAVKLNKREEEHRHHLSQRALTIANSFCRILPPLEGWSFLNNPFAWMGAGLVFYTWFFRGS